MKENDVLYDMAKSSLEHCDLGTCKIIIGMSFPKVKDKQNAIQRIFKRYDRLWKKYMSVMELSNAISKLFEYTPESMQKAYYSYKKKKRG